MNKKGKRIKDNNGINKLINLRISGFSEASLAYLFGADRTAVIYHFKKYGIGRPEVTYDIPRIVSSLIPPSRESIWLEIDGERINQGMSYKDYVQQSKRYLSHSNLVRRIYT